MQLWHSCFLCLCIICTTEVFSFSWSRDLGFFETAVIPEDVTGNSKYFSRALISDMIWPYLIYNRYLAQGWKLQILLQQRGTQIKFLWNLFSVANFTLDGWNCELFTAHKFHFDNYWYFLGLWTAFVFSALCFLVLKKISKEESF